MQIYATMIENVKTLDINHQSKYKITTLFNTLKPGDAYMHKWIGPMLVQAMACCLFSIKLLPKPMVNYCEMDSKNQTCVKFESKYEDFHTKNAFENIICNMVAILFWSLCFDTVPDDKVHGANIGPTWVLSAPDGSHVGSMNVAIRG